MLNFEKCAADCRMRPCTCKHKNIASPPSVVDNQEHFSHLGITLSPEMHGDEDPTFPVAHQCRWELGQVAASRSQLLLHRLIYELPPASLRSQTRPFGPSLRHY